MWSKPRVVIAPQPCTFRKCCAQSEKTATSPNCKKITQPSGAATPRNSDAHKRIAVPKALCVLWEHPRPSPKSGKVRRSDTRPGDVRERVARVEGNDSAPSETPPLSTCVPLCALFLGKPSVLPTFACESKRGPFVREVKKCDEERFGTTLWRQLFGDICVNSFGEN